MSASNTAGGVTSLTGSMVGGPNHWNGTAAPSPPASSQAGSSNAPQHSVLPLTPTPRASGSSSSLATSPLGTSSRPHLGDPVSKNGEKTTSHPAAAISTTPQGHPQSTASAGGLRSNAGSNQSLRQYPPSSSPGAAPTTVAASLPKANSTPPSSSTPGAAAAASPSSSASASIPSDASTFTTSFTTYDKTPPSNRAGTLNPRTPSPTLSSGPSVAHLSTLFSTTFSSLSTSSRGRLPSLVTSPTSDELSPVGPTPPPKSPRTLAFGNHLSSARSDSSLSSAFMGGSQSKPATLSATTSRSQQPNPSSHRLQKAHPTQQPAKHAGAASQLSPGGTTARGRVSRSPSPSPVPSSSASVPQSQSQQAPPVPRPVHRPSATLLSVSSSGSANSTSTKLKRAFAGRRKKSEDTTTLFGRGGGGASMASLVQQQTRAVPESSLGNASKTVAEKQLATQLLGASTNPSSVETPKQMASKSFGVAPVAVPSPPELSAADLVEANVTASSLSPGDSKTLPDSAVNSTRGVNRGSIIQLSPAITSAVNYMRNIVLAEEEGAGKSHVGGDAEGDRSIKEKLDQEDDQNQVEVMKVDDGENSDEAKVEQVQQQVRGRPPILSCTTMATATPSPGPSSPLSPSHISAVPWLEKDFESRELEREKVDQKEAWRKSDSTIGHHTIRANYTGASGTRTRPVSMAESFQSAYTIVPSGGGGSGSNGGNKRWSTVTGELDFQVMMEDPAEEEEERKVGDSDVRHSSSGSQPQRSDGSKSSRTPSAKNINRRSMSLNVGISSSAKPTITPAYVNVSSSSHHTADMEARPISYSVSEGHSPTVHSTATATAADAPGVSPPTSSSHSLASPHSRALSPQPSPGPPASGAHIASQSISVAALHQGYPRQYHHHHSGSVPLNVYAGRAPPTWTVTPPSAGPFPSSAGLNPKLPPPSMSAHAMHGSNSSSSNAPVSFRQTAISMSNGFAKKAAEKIGGIGKKWGLSTSSSGSGYSSTSSSSREPGGQPSSYSSSQTHLEQGVPLVRTHSNNSSLASSLKSAASLSSGITSGIIHHVHLPGRDKHKDRVKEDKKKRRTPNAPSGAYSVASSLASTSTSDSDGFSITGAVLGRLVRGPLKDWSGVPVTGGLVFGKDLKSVISQTRAIPVLSGDREPWNRQEGEREKLVKDLEYRMLPALVVRCAQHILIWGIQEEGLFRVSGRASHVTKLRSEFDKGVDYDLTDCAPGDLDPHAVASIFKAYLRELPEPLLTSRLQRAFEAALTQELATYPAQPMTTKVTTRHTPGLPSGPKGGFNAALRKPPSLSTLAMPSFKGMPSASGTLIRHLKTLIAQLPAENRDLMRTVVELITATARASKETKMPLSNLLLVFCPSLNMSPPLLKALCEAQGIWDEPTDPEEVLHIKRETILDISGDRANDGSDRDDDEYSDAHESLDFERQSLESVNRPPSEHPSSGYNASAENSMVEEPPLASERPGVPDRQNVPTVYLDTQSHCSSSSLSSSQDDVKRLSKHDVLSSQLLTSSESADSLLTPVSSGHPSLTHLPVQDAKKESLVKKKGSARDITKAMISNPIPIDSGLVEFPPSPPTPQKRRSIPILSLASFSSSSNQEEPAEGADLERRGKKPSLRRLFTKKSIASIGSGSSSSKRRMSVFVTDLLDSPQYTPRSASDSSVSTPLSAVTAPQSSISLPPILNTPIERGSSLSLALGIDVTPPNSAISPDPDTANSDTTFFASARSSRYSFGPSTASSLGAEASHEGPYRRRLDSAASASSNHLGLLDDDRDEEDWTQSVLIAAGAR